MLALSPASLLAGDQAWFEAEGDTQIISLRRQILDKPVVKAHPE
jgi:hypothetical protein